MKKSKALILLWSVAITIIVTGCRSVEVNKRIAKERDELDEKEQWRYKIPEKAAEILKPSFPQAKTAKLANGLEIFVVEDHRLPIAEVRLVLKGGSAKDPPYLAGLNYLTAEMLKEGTRTMTSLELAESFANLGTEVKIAVNKDLTIISSAVLSNKVDDIVSLLSLMAKEPRMAEEDYKRLKLQHESLLSSQQGVLSYVAQTAFLRAAYGDKHPYAHPIVGTLESVAKIKLTDIKKAHHENFGAGIAAIVAVGDVSLNQIEALAKKHFSKWKKQSSRIGMIPDPHTLKEMHTMLIGRSHSPQSYILIGQPVAKQKDNDLAILEVFENIVGGLPTSRLSANLREAKGWTYGISASVNPLLGKGPMMVAGSIQVPYGSDAIQEILKEFERLRHEPVTDAELTTAKNGLLQSFAARYNTVGKVADSVTINYVYSLPMNRDEMLYEEIKKVSKDNILNVAKRVLKKNNLVAIAVGDLETLEPPLAKMKVGKVTVEQEPQKNMQQ